MQLYQSPSPPVSNRNSKNLNSLPSLPNLSCDGNIDGPNACTITNDNIAAVSAACQMNNNHDDNGNTTTTINNVINNGENITLSTHRRLPPVPQMGSSPLLRQSPPPPVPKRTTTHHPTNSINTSPTNNNTTTTITANNENTKPIPTPHFHHHRALPLLPTQINDNHEILPLSTVVDNTPMTKNHETLPIKKDPMQASTWIKGLQMVSDESRGILSVSSAVAKTNNVNNQKIEEEPKKRMSIGKKNENNENSGASRHLPPPLKINRMESPNNDVNNELAKQLQKLKRTPATPTSSTSSNGSNPSSRHSSIELHRSEPETSAEKKLFEVVVVVKLKKAEKLEPFIDYEFPPQNVRSTKDLKLVMSIPLFCFPDIDTVKEETSLSGGDKKTYSFVLTEIDGTRKYGYCRRMLPKGTGKRLPETYCIISAHSCFGLFSTILDNIETRNEINNVACFTFLKSVLANPFPSPGTCTIVKTVNPKSGQQEEVKLSRPILADPMLEYINFNILFESLSADNIITMFAFLLMERRMVIFSNDISKLSAFCQAMISILYPFTWQHVFIPVLPQSLVDYVCSPVPFVIGVLSNHKPYIEELKKDGQVETEVLYIDIDSGKVSEPSTLKDQKKILPSNKDLIKKLAAIGKDIKNPKNSNQVALAKDTFLMFFVRLFGDYKAFIKPNPEFMSEKKKKDTPEWIFDVKVFLDYKKKNNKKKYEKFFINFVQCQMFERWSAEISNQNKSNNATDKEMGLFEQLSAIAQQQILLDNKRK